MLNQRKLLPGNATMNHQRGRLEKPPHPHKQGGRRLDAEASVKTPPGSMAEKERIARAAYAHIQQPQLLLRGPLAFMLRKLLRAGALKRQQTLLQSR